MHAFRQTIRTHLDPFLFPGNCISQDLRRRERLLRQHEAGVQVEQQLKGGVNNEIHINYGVWEALTNIFL